VQNVNRLVWYRILPEYGYMTKFKKSVAVAKKADRTT